MSRNLDWMTDAACRDHPNPDLFFPSASGPVQWAQRAEAERVCAACPVIAQCQDHKHRTGATAGVWGGNATKLKTGPSSGGPQNTAVCGTNAGYQRHYTRGETPCHSCWSAHSRKLAPNGRSKSTGFGGR